MELERWMHISPGPVVLHGSEAQQALEIENDLHLYRPGQGILSIPVERWRRAQVAEHLHWFTAGNKSRKVADDRNIQHFRRFAGFDALRGNHFSSALEIGNGPFTNLRLIGGLCSIQEATLVDPLNSEYENHRGTYLFKGKLMTVPASRVLAKAWPLIPKPLRAGASWFSPDISPVHVHSVGAEKFRSHSGFDLVVSINVLERCLNAAEVLQTTLKSLRPGGTLVFADKTVPEASILSGLHRFYDVAHPIRVSLEFIEESFHGLEELFKSHFYDPVSAFFPGAAESYYILRKPA